MAIATFDIDKLTFEAKALQWSQQFEDVCFFQSNGYKDEYSTIESLLAVNAQDVFKSGGQDTFESLQYFKSKYPQKWMLGFFSYDLKNEIEDLNTNHPDHLEFPYAYFFIPKTVIKFFDKTVIIEDENPQKIYDTIISITLEVTNTKAYNSLVIRKKISKKEYFHAFDKLRQHIIRGDIYEVNLCQEFYCEDAVIDPLIVFKKLNEISPTPFATFLKLKDKYILSASPERFLAKRGNTLISQPIKGTAPRGKSPQQDVDQITLLRNNPKEIAENVMIVDLVRNDMTRTALPGTVVADRKLEVHTFKQVHQLISTITCEKNPEISDIDAIRYIFPPGSMTGAPKISAMHLCDQIEASRRGVYAGTIGYFAPDGDFDFNVVIRTMLYNESKSYLSFHTGGAITIDAIAEDEYNECLLKASAIVKTLEGTLS